MRKHEHSFDRLGRRLLAVVASFGCLLVVASPASAGDLTPYHVAMPTVSGPIPSSPSNYPFLGDGFGPNPPAPEGYRVQEFFVSGKARIYEYTPTGVQVVKPCPKEATGTALPACTHLPYTTRMLVKYPANPRKFSGTVVVNPINPTTDVDDAAIWDLSNDYFRRSGDIYVGYTSKAVTVAALKKFNPDRYKDLHWPYRPVPGDTTDSSYYDGITYDVAQQIANYFKSPRSGGPLADYRVKNVIEAGYSQDGNFTWNEANDFSKLALATNGGPVFDAYLPVATVAPAQQSINFGLTPAGTMSPTDPRQTMQEHRGPVIQIDTQTELDDRFLSVTGGGFTWQRPDSDRPDDLFRGWEVPGASHDNLGIDAGTDGGTIDGFGAPYVLGVNQADYARIGAGLIGANGYLGATLNPTLAPCDRLDPNPFPLSFVMNAGFAALQAWIERGTPAPRAAHMQVANLTTDPEPVLDKYGNALGGVRTPYVDVPERSYSVVGTGAEFCFLEGYSDPLAQATFDSLYANKAGYVKQFSKAAQRTVAQGFWLPADARSAIEQASKVPR